MKNDIKQNYDQSSRNQQLDDQDKKNDKKNTEEDGYVDDTDFGPEVVKRNPNLVNTGLDNTSDDDFDNDLDDDEDNE
jgi:hypothetical protein